MGSSCFPFPWGEPGTELENSVVQIPGSNFQLIKISNALKKGKITVMEASSLRLLQVTGSESLRLFPGLFFGPQSLQRWILAGSSLTTLKHSLELRRGPRLLSGIACLLERICSRSPTAIFSSDDRHEKTWRIDAIPWSIVNTEAFAGLHNMGKDSRYL